jgi:competence protein ComGC
MLIVIATIALMAGLWLPKLAKAKARVSRINCVSNLKQIGLAARMFSNDHQDEFPWRVTAAEGGALESVSTGDPTLQYLTMTNELTSAKVLACPNETNVTRATNFAYLSRTTISYFLCLESDESQAQTLLSGDRNITGGAYSNRLYYLSKQSGQAGWGTNIHGLLGNVGLSDGSAQQVLASGLSSQLQMMTNEAVRLLVP